MTQTFLPVAFLSSLSGELSELRRKLSDRCRNDLWVAEIDQPELGKAPPMEKVDVLVEQLKRAELFICVLGGKRRGEDEGGTSIEVGDIASLVSYFEIEIFQAALHQIPVIFLERADFDPGPRLAAFLTVLKRSAIVVQWDKGLSDEGICVETKVAIRDRAKLRHTAGRRLHIAAGSLAAQLVSARAKLGQISRGRPDILWMHGESITSGLRHQLTLNRAKELLATAKNEKRHDRRLSRLYLVFRELMMAPYLETSDPEPLMLWNSTFGMWWGSSAWYGLHNHLAMGAIGALWSQHVVRERLRAFDKSKDSDDLLPPLGSLASAYYSLARICRHPWWRWRVSNAGIELANRVIKTYPEKDPTIYAVRGSLYFVQLQPWRGMNDFEYLLALAHKRSADLKLNAEAHTYLGRGYALTQRLTRAKTHLVEAVALWKESVKSGFGEEFLVKAMKNLLELQIKTRQVDAAKETAQEALSIARASGIYDQARQIEQILLKAKIDFPTASLAEKGILS